MIECTCRVFLVKVLVLWQLLHCCTLALFVFFIYSADILAHRPSEIVDLEEGLRAKTSEYKRNANEARGCNTLFLLLNLLPVISSILQPLVCITFLLYTLVKTHCCSLVFTGLLQQWCSGSGLTSPSMLSSTTPTGVGMPPLLWSRKDFSLHFHSRSFLPSL